MFSQLGVLIGLVPYILRLIKNKKLKKELKGEFENPLKQLNNTYQQFIENVYLVYGASSVGMFYQPQSEPEEKAKDIVENLGISYNKFIKDARKLIRLVRTHKDEFKQILKQKDWLLFEVLIEAFTDEKLDIEFLLENKRVILHMQKEFAKENKFLTTLNNEIQRFNKEEGIEIINVKYKSFTDMVKQIMVKMYRKDARTIEKKLKQWSKDLD
jgi:hypothetical protein